MQAKCLFGVAVLGVHRLFGDFIGGDNPLRAVRRDGPLPGLSTRTTFKNARSEGALTERPAAERSPWFEGGIVVLWLIALLQLVRFIAGWQVTLNGAPVPLWLSAIVAGLAAGLAIMVWRERPR